MNLPDIVSVAGKFPRRELQGPRPTPLKVRKDSHKIRKPPPPPPQQQPPPPPPVIIYTVSPKVIHANPSEFMTLVQRLTGPDSTYTSSSIVVQPSSFEAFHGGFDNGAVSPAARLASIEKTRTPQGRKSELGMVEGIELSSYVERSDIFPGVLSPNPASLPPIPPNIFSSPSGQNPLGYFPDLSPVLHSNKNYCLETSFMLPSPSTTFISPRIISPGTPSLDLFNNLFDL